MFGITTLMVGFVIHCYFFLMRRDTNRTVFAPHSKVAGFDLGLVSFHGFPLSPSPQLVTSENVKRSLCCSRRDAGILHR